MSREVKFTSFGVPYILEFENVSFVPEKRPRASPSSSTSSFCHIDTPPPPPPPPRVPFFSLPSPSSLFKRNSRRTVPPEPCANSESTKPLPPPPQSDVSEARGIYIRFPPGCSQPQMTRKERLVHLQQTISAAVLDAGMSRSPANKTHPNEHSNGSTVHGKRGYTTPNALFCGTYGQMIIALERAGLSATPCTGEKLSAGGCNTRLGALFVARNDGASGVQLRKITLWG